MVLYVPHLYRYSRLVFIWHDGKENFFFKFKVWFNLVMGFYFILGIVLNCVNVLKRTFQVIEVIYFYKLRNCFTTSMVHFYYFIFGQIRVGNSITLHFSNSNLRNTNIKICFCIFLVLDINSYSTIIIAESLYATICGVNIYYNYVITFLIQKRSLKLFDELQNFTKFGEPKNAKRHLGFVDILNFLVCSYIFCALFALFVQVAIIKNLTCTKDIAIANNLICGFLVQMQYYLYSIEEGVLYYLHFVVNWYCLVFILEAGALSGAACFTAVELVIVRLDHLKEKISEIFDTVNEMERKIRLRNCIRYHIYIIELVDRINTCYEEFLAPCHVTYSIIVGVSFLSILNHFEYKTLINVMGWILAIFMNCVCGERLMIKSTEIAAVLYDTKWYEGNPSIRKDIAFMMLRSQKPLCLKSGPYGILSLLTFKSIMKGGYTYATMKSQSNT